MGRRRRSHLGPVSFRRPSSAGPGPAARSCARVTTTTRTFSSSGPGIVGVEGSARNRCRVTRWRMAFYCGVGARAGAQIAFTPIWLSVRLPTRKRDGGFHGERERARIEAAAPSAYHSNGLEITVAGATMRPGGEGGTGRHSVLGLTLASLRNRVSFDIHP